MAEETEQRQMICTELKYDEPSSIADESIPCSNILKAIFSYIQKLGQTKSQAYHEYIGADLLRKPWRGQMQSRAEFIARSARQLARGKDPEDCELPAILQSEIMARISVEVKCEICRSRYWQSERNTLPEALSVEHMEAVEELQATRPVCRCNASAKNNETDDHEAYLLRLENLADGGEKQVDFQIESIIDTKSRHQACYIQIPNKGLLQSRIGFINNDMPFLVITSDSEEDGNKTLPVPKIVAPRACQLLLYQEGLRQDAGETTEWEAGPLSWQISHRGSLWSITACYFEIHHTDSCCIHVLPLWQGCIESVDHALQLLLIVDYIIDWGREIYRKAIVNCLFRASELEAKPMIHRTRTSMRFNRSESHSSPALRTLKTPRTDSLKKYDNRFGVVRDARFVKSLFAAFYVTEDNYGILMESLDPKKRKLLAESILKCLTEAWRVSKDALDALELSWTTKDREGADQYPKDKIFLVVVSATAYLTTSWEPTRELGYLAVAESLLDRLLETAGLQHHPGRAPAGFPTVRSSVFTLFGMLKQCTIQDTLKACVARKCYQTGIEAMMCGKVPKNERPQLFQVFQSEMTAEGMRHRLDVVIKTVSVSKARNIVFELLNGHMFEMSSSLFRVSFLLEELPRRGEALDHPDPPTGDLCGWILPPNLPDFEEKNVVLAAAADSVKAGAMGNEICIFIIDSTILEDGLPLATLLDTHPDWHLRVKRFNRKHAWAARDGNLNDFVRRDRSIEPDLAEYREHLRATALGSVSLDDVGSTKNGGFWAPKEFTKSAQVVTDAKKGVKFDFMDALRSAEAFPRCRISSMIWRNPPRNAKTEMKVTLMVDSQGNPLFASESKASGTRRESDGPEVPSDESTPSSVDACPRQLHHSEQHTASFQDIQGGETVVAVDAENGDTEAKPSKGKRPLWDGLPEHDIPGPSSKRPRFAETYGEPADALSDVEFDALLKAGAFN